VKCDRFTYLFLGFLAILTIQIGSKRFKTFFIGLKTVKKLSSSDINITKIMGHDPKLSDALGLWIMTVTQP
jgi:hypothetical protein